MCVNNGGTVLSVIVDEMMRALIVGTFLLCLALTCPVASADDGPKTDNINGEYHVHANMHYADKHTVTWGQNGLTTVSNLITLSIETAVYNCTNTKIYECEHVGTWMYVYLLHYSMCVRVYVYVRFISLICLTNPHTLISSNAPPSPINYTGMTGTNCGAKADAATTMTTTRTQTGLCGGGVLMPRATLTMA